MAIALVASVANSGGTGTSYTTSGIDTTGANLLVVSVAAYNAIFPVTVTDSKSNTWNALGATDNGGSGRQQLFWCTPTTVGSGHTFTVTAGAALYGGLTAMAFSGAAASSPFDVQNGGTGTGTTSTGSVTPTENGSLLVYGLNIGQVGDYSSVSIGTTLHSWAHVGSVRFGSAAAYYVQSTAAAINPSFTISTSVGGAARIAAFKAGAEAAAKSPAFRWAFPMPVLNF